MRCVQKGAWLDGSEQAVIAAREASLAFTLALTSPTTDKVQLHAVVRPARHAQLSGWLRGRLSAREARHDSHAQTVAIGRRNFICSGNSLPGFSDSVRNSAPACTPHIRGVASYGPVSEIQEESICLGWPGGAVWRYMHLL